MIDEDRQMQPQEAVGSDKALRQKLLQERSFDFAVRIVNAAAILRKRNCDYVLVRQLLRAGTSVGANIAEAKVAFTRAEFAAKLSIALKEGKESEYWIRLLQTCNILTVQEAESLLSDIAVINRMLYKTIRSIRKTTF